MTKLISYLTFDGNCREAMEFYQHCLGGHLEIQTIGESPLADRLPDSMKRCILHATLEKGSLQLMATDLVGDAGFRRGNSISLLLDCSDEMELTDYYDRLAEGGQRTHPIAQTFWGALFGEVTDRFGTHWLLHLDQ
ncbi:VOC family protein [Flavilitoribacter nigricans]|uniref:VOC family protein n=1 Tax=Flavilitoribacter nigricans (strain ATCC 23147 / DSM 23189 / NBRC 102662 / NCIMB 1420 / SS-2) TaxID=1122177 RepID=A0A2D0NAW7_FLAN2|nr:VOC family protein [Flavilitoribacter nigricans]PHN05635.1 VOC family protein [Flavilitoribacter nigricans DSM 23189 = NBRC 102662]